MKRYVFVYGALSLVLTGLILMRLGVSPKQNYSNTFEGEPLKIAVMSEASFSEDSLPQRILLVSADIDLSVKKAEIINGYWEVFADQAGWGVGSSVPGQLGNIVIFAHARQGLFYNLKRVAKGDDIVLFTKHNWYGYKVFEVQEVYPNNTQVIESTVEEILTLYTCTGFNDAKRLIVRAKRT